MSVVKSYSGSVTGNTSVAKKAGYGVTTNVNVSSEKTKLINDAIVTFAKEQGVDASYDGDFCWLNGVPFFVYVAYSATAPAMSVVVPFSKANVIGSTSVGVIFSGLNYNFKLAFDGNPKGTFVIRISTNVTTPTFINGERLTVVKIKDWFLGKPVIGCATGSLSSVATTSYVAFYEFGKNDDGSVYDLGYNYRSAVSTIATQALDFTNTPNKFPLFHSYVASVVIEDAYCYPAECGLSQSNLYIEAQTQNKVGDKTFWTPVNLFGMIDVS